MRLIGKVGGEKQATEFTSFLIREGIECRYDTIVSEPNQFEIWVIHEESIAEARHWLGEFQKNPNDSRFQGPLHPIDHPPLTLEQGEEAPVQEELSPRIMPRKKRTPTHITRTIIFLCVVFYLWSGWQAKQLEQQDSAARFFNFTPIFLEFAYDIPPNMPLLLQFFQDHPVKNPEELEKLPPEALRKLKEIDAIPTWEGLYGVLLKWPDSKADLRAPMFQQILSGQVWRVFTPVLLHGGFLHILFNMLWLFLLGKQVEERLKKWQYLVITVVIAIVSNTCQYLMSGPFFIGYSGVICGLAGFIWMRQRLAPWEGYPLPNSALIFLGVFILAMVGLQLVSFFMTHFELGNFPISIANTAHISGALSGLVLGRVPFLAKGKI